jgi:hypothetical protein
VASPSVTALSGSNPDSGMRESQAALFGHGVSFSGPE